MILFALTVDTTSYKGKKSTESEIHSRQTIAAAYLWDAQPQILCQLLSDPKRSFHSRDDKINAIQVLSLQPSLQCAQ